MGALDYAFFGPNNALYGIAGGPPDARRAVLVLSPPGVDAVRARRVLFRLVGALAAAGHGALLVDPRGSGESALAFEETSLETHVADVRDGMHELARRFPEARRRLIAVRYGAVPALSAVEPPSADALLLVDPCLDVRAALRQDLRGEIAKRMRRGAAEGDDSDRDTIMAQLDGGTADRARWRALSAGALAGTERQPPGRASGRLGGSRHRAAQRARDLRAVSPPAPAGTRDRRGARLRGCGSGLGERMRRRAFVVPAADGAAIVCTSHEPRGRPRSTIVIAPNGPLPRAGPFRSMTRLADCLCLAGHRVVRADLRGFGEAEADVPEATIHEHYRRIERGLHVEDLLAVMGALDDDGTPLVLFGSCGGAVTVRARSRAG